MDNQTTAAENELDPDFGDRIQTASPIDEVSDLLSQVRAYCNEKLGGASFVYLRLRIDAELGRLVGYIGASTGNNAAANSADPASDRDLFNKPIETFLGVPVERSQAIRPGDLRPSPAERDAYLNRRDVIYASFPETSDEDLLNLLRQPDGAKVLRGVAKKAGLDDFKEAPIDIDFIQRIKEAMAEKATIVTADQLATAAAGPAGGAGTGAPDAVPVAPGTETDPAKAAAALALIGGNPDAGKDASVYDLGATAPPPPTPDHRSGVGIGTIPLSGQDPAKEEADARELAGLGKAAAGKKSDLEEEDEELGGDDPETGGKRPNVRMTGNERGPNTGAHKAGGGPKKSGGK